MEDYITTHIHTPIVDESVLESALESADSANSNADSPKIGVWVQAFNLQVVCCMYVNTCIPTYDNCNVKAIHILTGLGQWVDGGKGRGRCNLQKDISTFLFCVMRLSKIKVM